MTLFFMYFNSVRMGYSSFATCDRRRHRQVRKQKYALNKRKVKKVASKKKKKKYKRAGLCIVFKQSNSMLFLRKRKRLSISLDKIEIPSGKYEFCDMDLKDTMIREAKEELLVTSSTIKFDDHTFILPDEFVTFWNTILHKDNISHVLHYTKEETHASDISIGIIIVDDYIPSKEFRDMHSCIYQKLSSLFFGGSDVEKKYIPTSDWCLKMKSNPYRNSLWKFLEAYDVEYVDIGDIPNHPEMNFKNFWNRMMPTLRKVISK